MFYVHDSLSQTASAHHPELWDPSWNLRTLVLSLRGFMTTQPNEIGSLRATANEKLVFMEKSKNYVCPTCNIAHGLLLPENENQNLLQREMGSIRSSRLLHSRTRIVDPAFTTKKSILTKQVQSKKSVNRPTRPLQGRQKLSNIHQIMRICVVLFGSLLVRHFVDAFIKYVNDVVI